MALLSYIDQQLIHNITYNIYKYALPLHTHVKLSMNILNFSSRYCENEFLFQKVILRLKSE